MTSADHPNRLAELRRLGAAVDAGQMYEHDAIRQLLQVYDGGLTIVGAADMLKHWRTDGLSPRVYDR